MKLQLVQISNLSDTGPREGWQEAFKKMAQAGDDTLLDADCGQSTFDQEEWEW